MDPGWRSWRPEIIAASLEVRKKIKLLRLYRNHGSLRPSRLVQRDVRVVTNVEVGCDGRDCCARRAQPSRTAKSCGPGLSTLRSAQRAKGALSQNGGKKADPQGEHEG